MTCSPTAKLRLTIAMNDELRQTREMYRTPEKRMFNLDAVGELMWSAAKVWAAGGRKIPEEYLHRIMARKKTPEI